MSFFIFLIRLCYISMVLFMREKNKYGTLLLDTRGLTKQKVEGLFLTNNQTNQVTTSEINSSLIMIGLSLATLMSSIDSTIVTIGLPTIAKSLDTSFASIQWIVFKLFTFGDNAYRWYRAYRGYIRKKETIFMWHLYFYTSFLPLWIFSYDLHSYCSSNFTGNWGSHYDGFIFCYGW